MFEWAEKHNIKLSKAQQLAIWFHDSIYVVLSKDSERRSADLLKALVGETNPPHVSSHAQCIITYTRDFMKDTDNTWPEGSDLVMDLDLSHFAREEEVFLYTNKLVKEEFVPVVGEEEYEKGRKDFFEQLLSRKNIFRTNLFKEKFEAKARENIEKVLRS
jgi:predicted metal-dependent HD superfamily phosphohydrolase